VSSLKSEHVTYWLHVTSWQLRRFKLIEDASNRLHVRSNYHSVLKNESHNQPEQGVKDFLLKAQLSTDEIPAYTRQNWSHFVIFSYWTHHQIRDINEEGCRIRRWSSNYAEDEVAQLGSNRGVQSVIANQLVARSRTEVHQDWWCVQGLVIISQFFLNQGPTKDEGSTKQNITWRCWAQQAVYEESDRNYWITHSRIT
jgi:hypothetical protein